MTRQEAIAIVNEIEKAVRHDSGTADPVATIRDLVDRLHADTFGLGGIGKKLKIIQGRLKQLPSEAAAYDIRLECQSLRDLIRHQNTWPPVTGH